MQVVDNVESQVLAAIGVLSPALANRLATVRDGRTEEGGASTIELVMYSFAFAVISAAIAYIIWTFARDQAKSIPNAQDPGLAK
jgi:hypothetical protein